VVARARVGRGGRSGAVGRRGWGRRRRRARDEKRRRCLAAARSRRSDERGRGDRPDDGGGTTTSTKETKTKPDTTTHTTTAPKSTSTRIETKPKEDGKKKKKKKKKKKTTTAPVKPATTAEPEPEPDRTAPTVTILSRPPAQTTSGEASISFRASEQGASFQCTLDGAAYHACSSPAAYHGLSVGEHAFAVRARDAAGNTGAAVTVRWTVAPPPDTTPPATTIVSASPSGGDVSLEFISSEAGSAFGCSLDGAAYEACASPRVYTGLAPGSHSFAVRATDPAGNTGASAPYAWTIAQPLPDLVVSALGETSFTVTNQGNAAAGPFVVSVTLVGTFTFSGLAAGQSQTRVWSACRLGTITAIADRGRTVAESNEDNNSRSITSDC
jgi:hypothetical protein